MEMGAVAGTVFVVEGEAQVDEGLNRNHVPRAYRYE